MAVVGQSQSAQLQEVLRNYDHDPMRDLAKRFSTVVSTGLSEQVDIFSEPRKFFMKSNLNNGMKNFFIEDAFDKDDPDFKDNMTAVNEMQNNLGQLYENDVKGLCEEGYYGGSSPWRIQPCRGPDLPDA